MTLHIARPGRRACTAAAAAGALALAACNLDVLTPGVVPTSATVGASALAARLNGALSDFTVGYSGFNDSNAGEGIALLSGLLSDEYTATDYFDTHRQIDVRRVAPDNSSNSAVLRQLYRALNGAQAAADAYVNAGQTDAVGRATAENLVGFEFVLAAESYCSGLPFSHVAADGSLTYGAPITTAQMLDSAVAAFTIAETVATAAGDDRELFAARVGRARALLDAGQFAAAAASASTVPTSFSYATEQGTGSDREKSGNYVLLFQSTRFTTADLEGGNGLPFVSAADPRLALDSSLGTSAFDGGSALYAPVKYNSYEAPTVIASGIEARLIEAEAALQAGNYAGPNGTLQKLNALRASVGLPPLGAAATQLGRVQQLFAERAFWLFGTAHRLGDLRRLARAPYSLPTSSLFPVGQYAKGGTYGDEVALRVPQSESSNPNYTADACDPTKP